MVEDAGVELTGSRTFLVSKVLIGETWVRNQFEAGWNFEIVGGLFEKVFQRLKRAN